MTVSKTEAATTRSSEAPNPNYYKDEGCKISPSCLTCPLPQCRYDDPISFQRERHLAKDFQVWNTIRSESLTTDEAAERFSVTRRTIFRIIRRCQKAEKVQQEQSIPVTRRKATPAK